MRSQKPSSRGAKGTRNRPCCTIQLVITVTSGERSSSAPEERSGNAAICASAMAAQNLARARSGWNGARDISRAGPAPQLRWGDTRPSSTPEQKSSMRLGDFSVLTFDCYGTLIDWESGICAAFGPWLERRGVSATPEQILAAFAAAEAPQQEATPDMLYPQLLARVHAAMAKSFGVVPDPYAAAALGRSVEHWPAFPDS